MIRENCIHILYDSMRALTVLGRTHRFLSKRQIVLSSPTLAHINGFSQYTVYTRLFDVDESYDGPSLAGNG